MSDLIKRSDAIEAMCGNCGWRETQCDPDERFWCEDGAKIRRDIPSAEITHDDVMQYCNSRLLVLATEEFIKHQYRIGFEDGKASADRPSGEWLWQLADNGWADHICSVCGYTKNTDIHVSLNWSYCPHCGSKMRGEHDD